VLTATEYERWSKAAHKLAPTAYNEGMPNDPAEILKQALALTSKDRADLAASLLESLDPDVDEDAEEAWSAEIQKRIQEIDNGTVEMIPWEEAERRLWARKQ
jgi:putative addiction module component (TIGR02574 family)